MEFARAQKEKSKGGMFSFLRGKTKSKDKGKLYNQNMAHIYSTYILILIHYPLNKLDNIKRQCGIGEQ